MKEESYIELKEALRNHNLGIIEDLDENKKISSFNKNVCIFGQGFVGLPLALSFAVRGCNVVGVDIDKNLVREINDGITYHTEKYHDISIKEILKMQLEKQRYRATCDTSRAIKESNIIIVTVGIPIKDGKYNMEYIESACRGIGRNINKGKLIIIRSTVIPGTTESFILPILEEESGMKAGVDFYLAYSSERIAEGMAFDEFENMTTLVGAVNEESLKRASELLKIVCKAEIVEASCIKAVETSKVFENVQRDVSIAMSQEFARFTEGLGIDIFEVVRLANTHKRVNLLIPGPGVGGYCIPNAYHYIAIKAKEMGINMDLLKLAREKNVLIPEFIVNKTEELLKQANKELKNSTIGVLGLAMKDYSNDDRISPPVDICRLLIEKGAQVKAFDPLVSTEYEFKVQSKEEAIKDADLLMFLTKQKQIDMLDIDDIYKYMNNNPTFIDTREIFDRKELDNKGLLYWKI